MADSSLNQCCICLTSLARNGTIGTCVPCGHVLHTECFNQWAQSSSMQRQSPKCAVCNTTCSTFCRLFVDLEQLQEDIEDDDGSVSDLDDDEIQLVVIENVKDSIEPLSQASDEGTRRAENADEEPEESISVQSGSVSSSRIMEEEALSEDDEVQVLSPSSVRRRQQMNFSTQDVYMPPSATQPLHLDISHRNAAASVAPPPSIKLQCKHSKEPSESGKSSTDYRQRFKRLKAKAKRLQQQHTELGSTYHQVAAQLKDIQQSASQYRDKEIQHEREKLRLKAQLMSTQTKIYTCERDYQTLQKEHQVIQKTYENLQSKWSKQEKLHQSQLAKDRADIRSQFSKIRDENRQLQRTNDQLRQQLRDSTSQGRHERTHASAASTDSERAMSRKDKIKALRAVQEESERLRISGQLRKTDTQRSQKQLKQQESIARKSSSHAVRMAKRVKRQGTTAPDALLLLNLENKAPSTDQGTDRLTINLQQHKKHPPGRIGGKLKQRNSLVKPSRFST